MPKWEETWQAKAGWGGGPEMRGAVRVSGSGRLFYTTGAYQRMACPAVGFSLTRTGFEMVGPLKTPNGEHVRLNTLLSIRYSFQVVQVDVIVA